MEKKTMPQTCCSPKLEGRDIPSKGYRGLFARQAVEAGELLTVYSGRLAQADEVAQVPPALQMHVL
jgi:hypothetical protein